MQGPPRLTANLPSIDSLDDRDVAKRVEVDASHSDAAETLEVLKERHRARRLALKGTASAGGRQTKFVVLCP